MRNNFPQAVWLLALVGLTACAVPAPVQEMSNARQSIQAAEAVKAQRYAIDELNRARELLDNATRELDKGEYIEARTYAMEAKMAATRARQAAINKQKK